MFVSNEMKEFEINKMIKESDLLFAPNVGEAYQLYERSDGSRFVSMIKPKEWTSHSFKLIGVYKIDSSGIWSDAESE
tara:strand:+ start:262 stop:492 length:231 start_codon:yes stop_codon:yes gene_type:complete